MLYGIWDYMGTFDFLTRKDVLGEDDHSPWLTTSKKRAEEVLHPLRDRYRQALVRSVTIPLVVHGNPEEM
jgi:hypothetical protein